MTTHTIVNIVIKVSFFMAFLGGGGIFMMTHTIVNIVIKVSFIMAFVRGGVYS